MRDCTDPDCHANAFLAAHAYIDDHTEPNPDPRVYGDAYTRSLADAESHVRAYRHPDPHADDDPTAATDY